MTAISSLKIKNSIGKAQRVGLRLSLYATAFASPFLIGACTNQSFNVPSTSQAFAQKPVYSDQVDVLWVIDTSGNMSQNQQKMAAQMPNMIAAFNRTGLDYQMAVTTMDMSASGEQGRFLYTTTTPAVLTESTPNMASIITSRLYIGDYTWHPLTRAMEAVQSAFTAPNTTSGPDAGFLRPNALLVLIFLSASNDQSAASANANGWAGWLDSIRPNTAFGQKTWVAEFMGVLPNDPNCQTSTWQYNAPGTAYIALANYSGGASASICSGDLTTAMTNVGTRLLELVTAYALSQIPQVSTLQVLVNNAVINQDPTNGWTYVTASNTIQFHGSAIPKVSDSIVVNFTPGTL